MEVLFSTLTSVSITCTFWMATGHDPHDWPTRSPASSWHWCCRPSQAPKQPRCLSRANTSGRRRHRWCAPGAKPSIVRENLLTSSRVQIRFLKVAAQRVHSCFSTNGVPRGADIPWKPWFSGLCEVDITPGCQRPPSNFSGSFACKGQGVGTDTWFVATQCPHFGF